MRKSDTYMTIDTGYTSCSWCNNRIHTQQALTSEILPYGSFCSEGCKDRARSEKQAECSHPTAVNKTKKNGRTYGVCEECMAEIEKRENEWRRA